MSQQRKGGSQGGKRSSGQSRQPGSATPRNTGSRPNVVRRPVQTAPQQSPLRTRIDQALPPFTGRRYAAIWVGLLIPLVFVMLVLTQCNTPTGTQNNSATPASGASVATNGSAAQATAPAAAGASGPGKYMIIDTSKGRIVAKLHTEPDAGVSKTIANFETKANQGEFNGRKFHRVEDWVIQGGDPLGNGTGGGNMPSEYNKLTFGAGAVGVARGGDPAINNDSQFFIVKTDASYLDGQYTNFGQVTEGMDVVKNIAIGDTITKMVVEDRK